MGRGGHDMGIFNRILEKPGSDQSGGVGHVNPQKGTDLVRYRAHSLVIPLP